MTRQANSGSRFRVVRRTNQAGAVVPPHAHEEAQLLFAASGTMQVYTDAGRWLVPPQLAVWLPVAVTHRIEIISDVELWMIFSNPGAMHDWAPRALLEREFALRVTTLLRELIFATFRADTSISKAELLVRLILQELVETPDAPTFLPLPSSEIGRKVAELTLDDNRAQLDIGDLASRAATSVRTISRLFPAETGLTFKAWRQRARIVLAIDELSAGRPIAQVAARAGFSSTIMMVGSYQRIDGMGAMLRWPGWIADRGLAGDRSRIERDSRQSRGGNVAELVLDRIGGTIDLLVGRHGGGGRPCR